MTTVNWNAEDYERNSQAQQRWARELLAQLALQGSEDILDLGCGDGKVTAEIARLVAGGSVVGVDSYTQMIALAKGKYPIATHPNLSFQEMDASDLSFTNRFDVVFSNAVLHWVKDHKPVLEGLFKSLRVGGQIVLRMGGKGDAQGIIAVMDDLKQSKRWSRYFADFSFPYTFLGTEEYQSLLNEVGLTAKRVELIPKDMTHAGESGLAGWIRTTWLPYTSRIPHGMRDEFIQEVCANYLARVRPGADGLVHVAMVMIEVEAEKLVVSRSGPHATRHDRGA